jgi:3,4-dihydroxy 2-butanone 4-phosphate synthase / GTP cyclohydrolase II
MTENGQALSSNEAYRKLGIDYDSRDYDASFVLLKHHIPNEKIQMVMNSPGSLVRKPEYAEALNRQKFDVEKWIFLDDDTVVD